MYSNRSTSPAMAPHGIYPCRDGDSWVAIACRHDDDWSALAGVVGEPWAKEATYSDLGGRLGGQDELDDQLAAWTRQRRRDDVVAAVRAAGVPSAPVTAHPSAATIRPRQPGMGVVAHDHPLQARRRARRRVAGAPVVDRLAHRARRPDAR